MTDQEVLELLRKIDNMYKPTEAEKEVLSSIEKMTWKCIENIPECINLLIHLKELYVSGEVLNESSLKSIPESIGNLTSLQSLDLSFTQLSELPESIVNLTSLQSLDLSFTQLSELPESIESLTSLQSLYLSNTQLSELPESIGNLTSLQSLDLRSTQLSELPESIGNLTSLQSLYLRSTQLSELPKSIGNLTSLQSLDLRLTQLSELPESIVNLTSLQGLYLSYTQLSELPESIGNLTSLQGLDLRSTQLSELPESIGNLTSLQSLYLSNTQLSELPESIVNLTSLQNLNLSSTQLSELPESIGNLTSLQSLDLRSTQLSELPESIENLSKLQRIDLEDLTLSELPVSLLYLNTEYKDMVFGIDDIRSGIYIHGLRLQKQPISLFYQSRELIQKYYDSKKTKLKESKVIFMGDGGAGKSYTIQRIMNNGHRLKNDTDVTHDISIEHWDNSDGLVDYDGTIDFWDFGGQDIYLSMHRCFLTERSCYVIVLCNRQYGSHRGLMRQVRYWLKNISSFAKKSPILIAVNTWSGQPTDGISLSQLKIEFPELNIVDQIIYDAHDEETEKFKFLVYRICRMAKDNYSYGLQFPISWNNVRNRLLAGYISDNLLSEPEYYQICQDEMMANDGYYDKEIARWLLYWFNDLGYCFNYHDIGEDTDGEEYYVLKPQWVIKAMYKIINYEVRRHLDVNLPSVEMLPNELTKRRDKEGRISLIDIIELLTDEQNDDESYTDKEAKYIIRILRKFKLAYLLNDKESEDLFIPVLCSDIRPETFDIVDKCFILKMEYLVRFRYLPETVLQHLMIKCYQKGRRLQQVWKYGFHLQVREGLIVVEMLKDIEIEIRYYELEDNNECYGLHEMRDWLAEVYKELGIENVRDFVIQKNMEPQQTALISVTALVNAYRANPAMSLFYAQNDDVYVGYSVDTLLSGLYGSNYKRLLLGEDKTNKERGEGTESKSPEALSGIIVTNEQLRQIISLLQELNDKKPSADSEAIDSAAQKIIKAMQEIHVDDISEKVREQELMKEFISAGEKGDTEKIHKLLSNSNTIAAFLSNLAQFGKYAALVI